MYKRMLNPGLMEFTVILTAFSFGMAQFLVQILGWRYRDPLGVIGKAFDPSMSILAFTVMGAIVWPVVFGMMALIAYDFYFEKTRNAKRIARRANHQK